MDTHNAHHSSLDIAAVVGLQATLAEVDTAEQPARQDSRELPAQRVPQVCLALLGAALGRVI